MGNAIVRRRQIAEALEGLARVLEAKKKQPAQFEVAAFALIAASGRPSKPEDIEAGDALYIQRTEQPGAGTVSKDERGRPFATALAALAAGKVATMKTALFEKRWITDGDPCEECDENALVGWIPSDEEFPSGHDEPDAHPNCKCSLETRRVDDSDSEDDSED
jgi:hypothetical protein